MRISLTESEVEFQSNWRTKRLGLEGHLNGIDLQSKPERPQFSLTIVSKVNDNRFESQ